MKTVPKQYRRKSQRVPKVYGTSFRKRMLTATSREELDRIWTEFYATMNREPDFKTHKHLSVAYRRRMNELALDLGPAVVGINPDAIKKCEFTGTVEGWPKEDK